MNSNQITKQRLHIDISNIQKNNYIQQSNNHFNLSLDIGHPDTSGVPKTYIKHYQQGLNRSYIEGESYCNQNDSSLIIGRKIENQNSLIISGSSTTQNQNIRKFPIPVDLMKTKKKNRSNSRGRASKLSNQDDSVFLDIPDIELIQAEQNYITQPNSFNKENQRQLYYQTNMRANNISLNEYDDGEEIIQMNSILTQQKANSKSSNNQTAASKSMKAISSGTMNVQNRSLSPQSNNTNNSNHVQAQGSNDNSTAFFGQVKKVKKVGGVLKVVKKSKTPKKKKQNKDSGNKNAHSKKDQKQEKGQDSSFLFQNKAIQNASYAIHNEQGFQDQIEMNNNFLEEFNSEKEFSDRFENNSNAAIDYHSNVQGEDMLGGLAQNQQHQEYVRMMQNITNQEDIINNKNSGRQTTFSFRVKGRNSQTPSSRQKKKKRSSSRNNEQNKSQQFQQSRSKSRSRSRQRAVSSQGNHKIKERSNSSRKFENHIQNQKELKKIKVGNDFLNLRCASQNANKPKNSPQNKNYLINDEKCKEVQQMILNNIKQKQKEEFLKRKNEEEENQKKALKKKENQQKNSEIRQMNAQKITVVKRSSDQSFAWGVDQQKFKQKKDRSRERSIKDISPSKSRTEKERREEMGLQFLNNFSQEEIDKLILKHKIWYDQLMLQNKENKKELSQEEQQKIHFYMQLQKKQKQKQSEENLEKQRKKIVKKNLENLDQHVREQRSKSSQRQRPNQSNKSVNQSVINIPKSNLNKDNSFAAKDVDNNFNSFQHDNNLNDESGFEDYKFEIIQNNYKQWQKEVENQPLTEKSFTFDFTTNSNNRSQQQNYDSKKSFSNQNSYNNTNIFVNPNNVVINNASQSTKSNVIINPMSNPDKNSVKTANNSKGHSRNNSNLNNSVLAPQKRSQSRGSGVTASNKVKENYENPISQNDQKNTICQLEEKLRQLKLKSQIISKNVKKQIDEKRQGKQLPAHNQSFSFVNEQKEHKNKMDKFTDHSISFNLGSNSQNNNSVNYSSKYNSNTNNRPASSQIQQRYSESNHIPIPRAKDSSKNNIPQRHSDIVGGTGQGSSSRQSNHIVSVPSPGLNLSRPQSKLSDKKQKNKKSQSKDNNNQNTNNQSGKKNKKINNQNNNQNFQKEQKLQNHHQQQDPNLIFLNNNFNSELIQYLQQLLTDEQIASLTQEELLMIQQEFLQKFQNLEASNPVYQEEEEEYYEDEENQQENQQPYYQMQQNNPVPNDYYNLNTSQNHVRQLYENYCEEDNIVPEEDDQEDFIGHQMQAYQIYGMPQPQVYDQEQENYDQNEQEDFEIEDRCNAHEHLQEDNEQVDKAEEVANNNVDEPFEIEELDTSNFSEKGQLQSTINNEDKKSQQSSQRSEQELNIMEMRRIEKEYQENIQKQPNQEKSTTFKNKINLSSSLNYKKQNPPQMQNKKEIPEEIITSAKKQAARVIIRRLKELKTRRVVTRAFKRYLILEDQLQKEYQNHYDHAHDSDQLNEGMQIYTERNESASNTNRNPNDERLIMLNLQTSSKHQPQEQMKTPKSVNNQTYNNTENITNMKEITSTLANKKIYQDVDDEEDKNFNKELLGNSNGIYSKANRAIDDYSLDQDEEEEIINKSSMANSINKNNQNIIQDSSNKELQIEEIPFSKYGFIKSSKESNSTQNKQKESNDTKIGRNPQQQTSNKSNSNPQITYNQTEKLQQYNYNEDEEEIEIQDEFEFDQLLQDLHKQAMKNSQNNVQGKQNIAQQPQNSKLGSKFEQIEKIIITNQTEEDNINEQNNRTKKISNQNIYQGNNQDQTDDQESQKKQINDEEEEEFSHLNKNKYQSDIKGGIQQRDYEELDQEQQMIYRQLQRDSMKSRIQNYQQQDFSEEDQINIQDYEDDFDQSGQNSFQSSHRQQNQNSQGFQDQNLQQNSSKNKSSAHQNMMINNYLDQSLSDNKAEISKQSSKQLSKPNSSEELIELLAKQQLKKPQQSTDSQAQSNKQGQQEAQITKNIKKKPQLNLSIKSNDQNFEVEQEIEQINTKNNNSKHSQKSEKQKVDDTLINELGINEEWSNQHKKTSQKNLYETDMQVLGGSSNEIFENQTIQNSNYQRQNFLMTSGALDTQKLNNLIAGGQQRYQMSSEDKKYLNQDDLDENQGGGVNDLVGLNDPQQNNTLLFKEINEHQRSLVTVKEFDKSDFLDMTKGMTSNIQSSSANNKKRRDKSSTEFLREKLNDELNRIDAIPEISNTFMSENSEHQSNYSSVQHSRQPSSQNNKNSFNQNQSSYQENSQKKSHNTSVNSMSKSMMQQYENEITKIKEEEAQKWNQMIALLNDLQNQGSIPKEAAEQMKLLSEINRKYLEYNQQLKENSLYQEQESLADSSIQQQSNKKPIQKQQQFSNQISSVDEADEKFVSIDSNSSQKFNGKNQENQQNFKQKKDSPFKFDLPQPYEKQVIGNEKGQFGRNSEDQNKINVQSGEKSQKQQRKKDLKIDVDKITESYFRNETVQQEQEEGKSKELGENNTIKQQDTNNSNQLTTNSNLNNLSRNNNNISEDKMRFEDDFLNNNNINSGSNATNTQKNLTSGSEQTKQLKQQSQNTMQSKQKAMNDKQQSGQRMNFYDEQENSEKQNIGGDEQSISSCTSPSVSYSMVQKHLMRVHTHSTDGEESVRGSSEHQIKSIFEQNSFGEQFDDRKLKELLQMDKIDHIFDVAQQALNVRREAKNKKLQNMFDKQRISPKSFYRKQQELEKWVSKEQQQIEKTKLSMQKTILSTEETIKKTQRDIEFSKQMKKKAVLSSNSYKNLLPNSDFDIYRVSLSEEEDHMNSSASSSHRYYLHHHHPHPQQIPASAQQQQNKDIQKHHKKKQQHEILLAACTPDSESSCNIKVIDDFDCSSSYDQTNQQIFADLKKINKSNLKNTPNNNQLTHTGAAQSLANSSGSSRNNLSNPNINSNNNNNNNISSSQSLRKLSKDKSQHQLQNLDEASNQASQKSFNSKNVKDVEARPLTDEEKKNLQFEKKRGGQSSLSSKRNPNSSPEGFQEDDFESLHSSSVQQSSQNSLRSNLIKYNQENNNRDPQIGMNNIQINIKNTDSNSKVRYNSQDSQDLKYIDESSKNFLNGANNNSDLIQQRKGSLNRSGSHQPSQQTSSIETIEDHDLPPFNKADNYNQQINNTPNQLSAASVNIQSRPSSDKKKLLQSNEKGSIDQRSVEKTNSKQSEDHEVDISGDEDLNQSIEWEDDLPQPKRVGVMLQKNNQKEGENQNDNNFDLQNDFLGDHKSGNFYQKQIKQYSVQQNSSIVSVQSVSNNNSALSAAPNNIYNPNNNQSSLSAAPYATGSQNFLKLSNAKSDRSDLIYSTSKDIDNVSEIYLTAEKDNHHLQEIKELSDDMVQAHNNNNQSSDLNIHEMELLDDSASQLYQNNYQNLKPLDSDSTNQVNNPNISGGDFIVPDAQKGINGGFIKLSNLINQYNPGECLSNAPLQKVSPTQSETESNENIPVVQTQSQCLKIEDQMHENEPKQQGVNNKSHYLNKFEIDQEENQIEEFDDDESDHFNQKENRINSKSASLNHAQQKHLQDESLNEQQNQYIQQQKIKQSSIQKEDQKAPEKEAENVVSIILNDLLKEAFDEVQTIQSKRVSQQQGQQKADGENKNNQPQTQMNQRIIQRQGFKTNLNTVKEYIHTVSTHISNDNDYKTKFLTHINTWLGPQPEELLKLLHMYDGQEDQLDTSDESSYSTQPILDGKLYTDIERKRNIQPSQDKIRDNLIQTLERIHNKAIFEAFNEALDYQRMYGLRGKPFPWKITHEKISEKPHSQQDIPKILQKASEKVIEWSSCLCGIIVDKEDSQFQPGIHFDEDYLQQIKEDRLNRMLSAEVIENEEKWILYDEEQTEVQVELSQMVFDLLIYEACNEFRKISNNQLQLFNEQCNTNNQLQQK
ncbi:IQ calmodulin-binding motif protein, putative (macronuclear) [Tetrahymena thermophila SB210]|uniref:IQ calmodulin-binding motif protein, putative n=1 Tax=Tetrahymena thermophila (strain SB210) TaxID=312017 RepID=I7MCD9_TETTS|nr:IQ calmodulin-binding motif protein, putative [Tetrahymena thermophila SB210]EAR83714.2 IQ calmodulin-binding motif protein, putative [Tetrahymena thermophila SB210]|eukprot:XP_001031377.2 IQ calmodulin-binding motif protein, putative [Tetrahymena thermophila SB210]